MRCGIKAKLVTQGGKGGLGAPMPSMNCAGSPGITSSTEKITSDETSKLIRNNASFLKI